MEDLRLHNFESKSTFLNDLLNGEIYMKQPKGFEVVRKEDYVGLIEK